MSVLDYLSYIVNEIHTTIVATVDDDGLITIYRALQLKVPLFLCADDSEMTFSDGDQAVLFHSSQFF